MASFVGFASFLQLSIPGKRRRSLALMRLCTAYSRYFLRTLNVRCHLDYPPSLDPKSLTGADRCLFLPNHVSYLDVMVLHAVLPAAFVTSREVKETPGLGWITRAGGCLFVDRQRRLAVQRDLDALTAHLNAGLNLVLFPEGSTTPGDHLLPFKSSLLAAASRSRCRVIPVALKYVAVNGSPLSPSNRDSVAWYGSMTFFPHLLRLAATRSIEVRLSCLDSIAWRSHNSRKRLGAATQARIAARLAWSD